jgi:hypothetical protein
LSSWSNRFSIRGKWLCSICMWFLFNILCYFKYFSLSCSTYYLNFLHNSYFSTYNFHAIKKLRERISNKNLHMIRLNLIEVIAFIVFNLPNTMYSLYSFITRTNQKTSDQILIDNFFNYLADLV